MQLPSAFIHLGNSNEWLHCFQGKVTSNKVEEKVFLEKTKILPDLTTFLESYNRDSMVVGVAICERNPRMETFYIDIDEKTPMEILEEIQEKTDKYILNPL